MLGFGAEALKAIEEKRYNPIVGLEMKKTPPKMKERNQAQSSLAAFHLATGPVSPKKRKYQTCLRANGRRKVL